MDSIVRWAGSKKKILRSLIASVPDTFETYIEPFAGSACLFFALQPKKAILNDINKELIFFYRTLNKNAEGVYAEAEDYIYKHNYNDVRSLDPNKLDDISRAARFIYLNRFCYNGLYRTNKAGLYNVPKGNRTGKFPNYAKFASCAIQLHKAQLWCRDFSDCLMYAGRNDFAYIDPPYLKLNKQSYGVYEFDKSDMERLILDVYELNKRGIKFAFSYFNDKNIIDKFKGFSLIKITTRRSIGASLSSRAEIEEVIITNWRGSGALS